MNEEKQALVDYLKTKTGGALVMTPKELAVEIRVSEKQQSKLRQENRFPIPNRGFGRSVQYSIHAIADYLLTGETKEEPAVQEAPAPSPAPAKRQIRSGLQDLSRMLLTKNFIASLEAQKSSFPALFSHLSHLVETLPAEHRLGADEWTQKLTVISIDEATARGLHPYLVEGSGDFPVFTYEDGLNLNLKSAIKHEKSSKTTPEKIRVVNMGNAMQDMAELSECLTKDLPRASELIKNKAQSFDVAYWFYHQTIFGKLDSHQPFVQAIRLLLKNGMDINTANNLSGYTLAHVLGLNQWCFDHPQHYKEFVSMLLDEGLDLDKLDHQSMSALDYAHEDDEDGPLIAINNSMSLAGKLESILNKKEE